MGPGPGQFRPLAICSSDPWSSASSSVWSTPCRSWLGNKELPGEMSFLIFSGLIIVKNMSGKIFGFFWFFIFLCGVLGPGKYFKGFGAIFRFISTYLELQISILDLVFPHVHFCYVLKTRHISSVSLKVSPSSMTSPIFSVSSWNLFLRTVCLSSVRTWNFPN